MQQLDHFLHLEKALPTSWLFIYLITFHNLLYLHWTTRWFESLRGCSRAGCHTRQSSFFPFMLRRGCREKKLDTEPLSLVRFCICPGRSVSHETRGVGRPTARQEAAWWNDWPSIKTSPSKEEMGKTKRRAGGTEGVENLICLKGSELYSNIYLAYFCLTWVFTLQFGTKGCFSMFGL